MGVEVGQMSRVNTRVSDAYAGSVPIGEALSEYLDKGSRTREAIEPPLEQDVERGVKSRIRRFPTNSERLNRALTELRPAAFKIHLLLWRWRGAPARGTLPFFTIHSLAKFCNLARPTVRKALRELTQKGWISRAGYSVHHKNTLYRLVSIRRVRLP